MNQFEIFLTSAGTFSTAIRGIPSQQTLLRAGCAAQSVEHVVFGQVIPTMPRNACTGDQGTTAVFERV